MLDAVLVYRRTLAALEPAFQRIASRIEPPETQRLPVGFVFRFRDRSLECAVVQKLARVVSGLHAALHLLEAGFVQELGVLQRGVDELGEDVTFLCQPLVGGERTPLHDEFLAVFFEEEFPGGRAYLSDERRPQIRRQKIHAALARVMSPHLNPSDSQKLFRRLAGMYSGYVHAASPHIMDMYVGDPPHFHVSGLLGTPRVPEHMTDLGYHFHRSINVVMLAAFALKDLELSRQIHALREEFERALPGVVRTNVSEVEASIARYRDRPRGEEWEDADGDGA